MKSTKIKLFLILAIALQLPISVFAQDYTKQIKDYRAKCIKELMEDQRAPLKPGDDRYLRYYAPDQHFCIWANVTETPGSKPFLIATHSGKQKPFKEFGTLTFMISDTEYTLHVYQSVNLLNDLVHKDDLFLPFTDESNYTETFGGGRFLDLSIKDINNGRILLDFNKCYNMLCAYTDGFSCPIPPSENFLRTFIRAGEKMFAKNIAE